MFSKVLSRSAVLVLGWVFFFSLCIGLSGNIALAGDPPDLCGNNDEFTKDFRLEDCKFKDKGENPYFILKPGYRLVLEDPGVEKSVETVLRDKKRSISTAARLKPECWKNAHSNGMRIKGSG